MRLAEIRVLFDYNSWATRRILSVARALSAEQYTAPSDFPCGSLRDTLLHMLSAERNWLARWQEQEAPPELTAAELPTLADLTERWRRDEGRLHAYLATLTDADLDQRISYTLGDGTPATDRRWTVMAQMVNHGTQHRTEAAQLLTTYGHSPDDLDLLIFLHLHEF
jgi:uncharacterized damage-inducible protein DinB